MTDAQLQHLLAVRESAHALVLAIDDFAGSMMTAADQPCMHPLEKRLDCSAMGHPRFQCGVCKEIVETEQT